MAMVPSQTIRFIQFQSDQPHVVDSDTIVETPVSLTVNGSNWLTFMCTPILLEEMAVGFLFNEGVITTFDEVADVHVCEHEDNIDVWLNRSVDPPVKWRRTSGCSGGVTAVELLSEGMPVIPSREAFLTAEQINALVVRLFESQELYRETGGVHTSLLSDGSDVMISAEDIGRHNTLDKIAGASLRLQLNPPHKVLITTGRISSEMLQKASRLGAEVLISRTSPSSLSIQLAERMGITLIGYARRNRFNVYAHPERISDSASLT
jgi:FdhD protein